MSKNKTLSAAKSDEFYRVWANSVRQAGAFRGVTPLF